MSAGYGPAWDDDQLSRLAAQHGTPLYLLDVDHALAQAARLSAFDVLRYAQKANPNPRLLARLAQGGHRVDAMGAGELLRAERAGFDGARMELTADLFDGAALEQLLRLGARPNAGSLHALEALADAGYRGPVTLRVNPGFGSGHDRRVTTGGDLSKHGIWHADLEPVTARAQALGLVVTGLHQHIGSGADEEHLAAQTEALGGFLRRAPESVVRLSAGGGLPVPYREWEPEFDVAAYGDTWRRARDGWARELGRDLELEVEPGRYVVAHAGLLLTRVHATKRTETHDWVLVDAGFHTLARPMLYGAYHRIRALGPERGSLEPRVVAGPLCEAADVLTQGPGGKLRPQPLPPLVPGDLLAVHDVGAYGVSMASTYNGLPLPAEVTLEGGQARLSRRRQSLEELLSLELPAEELPSAGTSKG